MKIYLAARYSRHPEMQIYRDWLEHKGHVITSRWINGDHEIKTEGPQSSRERVRFAMEDLEDLLAADRVISFTEPPRTSAGRGGRHVEFGIALALEKHCVVIGHRENVFHWLPFISFYETWDEYKNDMELNE